MDIYCSLTAQGYKTMLKKGDTAPSFTLEDASGKLVSLSDFIGKKVVLYFYPKDNTPGCTKEACGFKDKHEEFTDKNAVIVGVSKDSAKSHQKFIDKYELNFTLLSDPDVKVCAEYGVWAEKKNYGKTYMGIVRSTFIIDEDGKIADIYSNVRVAKHVDKVLEAL